jgi:acetyltransferase-like isoleucine patch superfamily enzyme
MNSIMTHFAALLEGVLRNIGGGIGTKMRYWYYKKRLKACGINVRIGTNVVLQGLPYITIGDGAVIDANSVLVAGKAHAQHILYKKNKDFEYQEGDLVIGQHTHIGIATVIQAHGGVQIADYCTTSAGCKIYSLSNDYAHSQEGTLLGSAHYISKPVVLKKNVWLGLNVTMLGGTIAQDCFALPNSVIWGDIPENSVISGSPAQKIKVRFT